MSLNITLSENMMDILRRKAEKLEITPNMLARIHLCQIYNSQQSDAVSRAYIVEMKNWHEIEAYVEERGFGDLSIFLNKAAEWYMRKNHLSAAQKAAVGKNINE
jgi:hypothetical protein